MPPKTATIPLSKPFQRVLSASMAAQVQARFLELYTACERPANATLDWHLRNYILPGLAFYQLLRAEGHSQEAALAIVDETFERLCAPNRRRMKLLGRLPFIYPFLRLYIKPAMQQYPAPGWQLQWVENSPGAIRFNMKSCFYHTVLAHHGAPELTASFCKIDDRVYGEMSPYIEWRRTQTIGRGAAECDFCFARVSKEKNLKQG